MDFQALQRYIYRRTGHPDSPVAEVSTRVKQFINERQREILGQEGMNRLRQYTLTFASDTSNSRYALPQAITRILGIHERTNDYPLAHMSRQDYRMFSADPTAVEGTPTHYVELGHTAVSKQPADNSEIFIKSSSASDTAIIPYFEFIQAQKFPRTVTGTTLDGTTAVSADTSLTDISHVTNFFLSATPVGNITLHEDSGAGTRLAQIQAGDTRARYKEIALYPKPSAAVTYFVDGEVEIRDMVQNTDESLLPEQYHWVLAELALHDEYLKKEKAQEAQRAWDKATLGTKALKNYVTNPPDFLPVQGTGQLRGTSRLGPWFPADQIIG